MMNGLGVMKLFGRILFGRILFASSMLGVCASVPAATLYVDLNSPGAVPPYDSWATAATNIQEAVDAAASNDTVLVADGHYFLTSVDMFNFGIVVTNSIAIESVNGADVAIIDGQNITKCINFRSEGCSITGFTIQNGEDSGGGDGAGINSWYSNMTATACVFNGNRGAIGGGMHEGVAIDCVFTNNHGTGGGMAYGIASNCTFIGNSYSLGSGGGMHGGTAYNCDFENNTGSEGGGSFNTIAYNCIYRNNRTTNGGYGGGMKGGVAYNCLFVGNETSTTGLSAGLGGGMHNGEAFNCTFVSNMTATGTGGGYAPGGGMVGGQANNCIFWNNLGDTGEYSNGESDFMGTTVLYSCSTSLTHGVDGNITNAPMFVDEANGDYRLLAGSPCIDAGSNGYVTTSFDLDGNPRIQNSTVDMGAYEFGDTFAPASLAGSVVTVGDPSADFAKIAYGADRYASMESSSGGSVAGAYTSVSTGADSLTVTQYTASAEIDVIVHYTFTSPTNGTVLNGSDTSPFTMELTGDWAPVSLAGMLGESSMDGDAMKMAFRSDGSLPVQWSGREDEMASYIYAKTGLNTATGSITTVGMVMPAEYTFVSPSNAVLALVEDDVPPRTNTLSVVMQNGSLFWLDVENGSGDGAYAPSETASIVADAPATGFQFDAWTGSGAGSVSNAASSSTTLIMPSADIAVMATYASVLNDSDSDGMGDEWETLHFGDLLQDADGDFDKDGRTNVEEHGDGTDPVDAGSTLGLMAYYPCNGDLVDATGNGFDGVAYGGALYGVDREGVDGSTFDLNGVDCFGKATATTSMLGDNPDEWSYSCWFRSDDWGKNPVILSDYDSTGWDNNFGIAIGENSPDDGVNVSVRSSGVGYDPDGVTIAEGEWHQITVSVSKPDAELHLFVDGQLFSSCSILETADYFDGSPLYFGINRFQGQYDRFFDGALDDVRIYSRALASNEVARLYGDGVADTDSDGLPDYWELQYFPSLDETGLGDSDSDGRTNAEEYSDKTDPTDAGSTFGLTAFYQFDGDLTDATGNGNDAVMYGGYFTNYCVAGGNSVFLDNRSTGLYTLKDYLLLPQLTDGTNFSVVTWFKYEGDPSSIYSASLYTIGDHPSDQFRIEILDGNGDAQPSLHAADNAKVESVPVAIADGQWHQLVATVGTNMKFYVDGQFMNETDGVVPFDFTGDYHYIGMHKFLDGQSSRIWGMVDEVRVYDRPIASNEVAILYQAAFVSVDSDVDGLMDVWEQQIIDYDVDDAIEDIFDVLPGDDFDVDFLSNFDEHQWGSDPCDADSDGDGVNDGVEVASFGTSPTESDSDGDGLSDLEEIVLYPTDPTDADSDNDGWLDGEEIANSTSPFGFTDGDDGDGMPNAWEYGYFNTVYYGDADNYDSDLFSNLAEYIAGTDPVDPYSYFLIGNTIAEVGGTNRFVVGWNSITGRYYNVQWSTNLASGFQSLEGASNLEHPQDTYTDTTHGAESKGFYKVDVRLK